MSKYLVKILSICALVVLLAVSVVGSAICVTEAVGCTLTVVNASEVVEEEGVIAESNVAIFVDGKKQDKTSVHVSKYTEVEVVYTGIENGYKFNGWYQGNYDITKDKPASEKTSYKFEINKSTKLTAVANLRRITVGFEGFMADGSPITIANGEYVFGQELPKLPSSESKYFQGWQVATEDEVQDAQIFTFATFEQENVVVVPVWGEQEYIDYTINIAYKPGSDIVDQVIYNSGLKDYSYTRQRESYTLIGAEFDGKIYPYKGVQFEGLGDAVARKGLLEVDVAAVWECDYDSFIFNFDAQANYYHPDFGVTGDWIVKASKIGSTTVEDMEYSLRVYFNDIDEENYFDLDAVATSLLIDQYQDNYQTLDGRKLSYTGKIQVTVSNGANVQINTEDGLTFRNIVGALEEVDGLDAGLAINVTFIFGL